jgi:hypothetical protein
MKKILTLLALAFLTISGSAQQQVSITIDTIYYLPSNPSVGDNISIFLSGTANCQFIQQGPAFIADTGHFHSISICYVGNTNTPPSNFAHTYTVYHSTMSGQDTLHWMFFYNKHDTTFCDTVLRMGTFYIQVDPAAVFSQQSPSFSASWNPYSSSLTFDRLNSKADFRVMDMSGRIIQEEELNAANAEIKVTDVEQGIYLIYIADEDGLLYRRKVFIEE